MCLTFCKLPGLSAVLSMILMATSLPVGICFASLTLAKLPLPMVLRRRYLPMCGSSPVRRDEMRVEPPSVPWKRREEDRSYGQPSFR